MARLLLTLVALALGFTVGTAMVAVGTERGLALFTGALLALAFLGVWRGRV